MRYRLALVTAALAAALAVAFAAPSAARPAPAAAVPELFKTLPPGDAVVTVDAQALFGKVLPALLASRPESKAKLDANIARVRTDFGIDLKQVRQIALSAAPFGRTTEWVAVFDGTFDSVAAPGALGKQLDEYVKRTPKFSVRSEQREGATVYVLPEKLDGGSLVERNAVAVLDATTALFGTPDAVRGAIDARKGKTASVAANATLVEAYGASDAASPVRLGLSIESVVKAQTASDPDDDFLKTLADVRYVFGSLAMSGAGGVELKLTSRATKPEAAKSIRTTLGGLMDLARGQTADSPDLAALLALVTVTATGNDVVIAATVPPDKVDSLFRLVDKNRAMIAAK